MSAAPVLSELLSIERLGAALGGVRVLEIEIEPPQELEQSSIALVRVRHGDRDDATTTTTTLVAKLVHVPSLRARIPKSADKWLISVRSFENEYSFYARRPIESLRAQGIRVPRAVLLDASWPQPRGADGATSMATILHNDGEDSNDDEGRVFDRWYLMVLEHLSDDEYHQMSLLSSIADVRHLVAWLARFHAFFWDRVELVDGSLPQGAWWRQSLRPSVKFDTIPAVFDELLHSFDAMRVSLDTRENHQHMAWLRDNVARVAGTTARSARTLVHGDCKMSNLFFRRQPSHRGDTDTDGDSDNVAVIDYQWCAPNSSGMSDVVYALVSCISFEALAQQWYGCGDTATATTTTTTTARLLDDIDAIELGDRIEAEVLHHYHRQLHSALVARDGHSSYTFAELERDYEWEFLDYFKTAMPQLWPGLTSSVLLENRGKYGWLAHEMERHCVQWMCHRALTIIRKLRAASTSDVSHTAEVETETDR